MFREVDTFLILHCTLLSTELVPSSRCMYLTFSLDSKFPSQSIPTFEVLIPSSKKTFSSQGTNSLIESLLRSCFLPQDTDYPSRSWLLLSTHILLRSWFLTPRCLWLQNPFFFNLRGTLTLSWGALLLEVLALSSRLRLKVLTSSSWCSLSQRTWSLLETPFVLDVLISLRSLWGPGALIKMHFTPPLGVFQPEVLFPSSRRNCPYSPHCLPPKYFRAPL